MTDNNRFLSTTLAGMELISFTGEEALSSLFAFTLYCQNDELAIKAKDMLGKDCGFSLKDSAGTPRHFHGIIRRFIAGPLVSSNRRSYQIEVVPTMWLLTQQVQCRVFEKMTATDILKRIFDEHKVKHSVSAKGSSTQRDYCVQFNESDFNFVSRLMEEEGITYFFKHTSSGHTLHVIDSVSGYGQCVEKDVVQKYSPKTDDHISDWSDYASFHTGNWEMDAYDLQKPSALVNAKTKGKTEAAKLASFSKKMEYLSPLPTADKGRDFLGHLTQVRMEQEECGYEIISAASTYRTFSAGHKFKIKEHDIDEFVGQEYVITTIFHSASEGENITGRKSGHEYRNHFSCIPATVIFRPKRVATKPRINGLLTGTVTAQSTDGPEIDKFGRLKIMLHWETSNKKSVSSQCIARVAQSYAGNKWGSFVMPDVGHEVLVSFIDGDPDCPVAVGSVYNGQNALPLHESGGKATQMGFRTSNGNEFIIENKKDSEKIFLHSKKDYEVNIDNCETKTVKSNKSLLITDGDDKIEIKKGKRDTTIEKDDTKTLKTGNYKMKVEKGNFEVGVDVGEAKMTVMKGIKITSNKEIELVVGPNSIKIDMQGIELKTATASIKLDASGKIATQAINVETKAQVGLKMEGTVSAELKSPLMTTIEGGVKADFKSNTMVNVQSSVMTSISGTIAKIN